MGSDTPELSTSPRRPSSLRKSSPSAVAFRGVEWDVRRWL